MSLSWRNNSQASLFRAGIPCAGSYQVTSRVTCVHSCHSFGGCPFISAYTPLLTNKSRQPGIQTETRATKDSTSRSFLTVSLSNLSPTPAITLSQPTTHHTVRWDYPVHSPPSISVNYKILPPLITLRCHPHWPHSFQHCQCPVLQESFTTPTCSLEQGLGEVQ